MNIFNSLGSNYNFLYVIQSLFLQNDGSRKKLINVLSEIYGGQTLLTYKGREAISRSLELSQLPKGSGVAVNGFTCIAVVDAIKKAGYTPVFIDIDPETLNFTAEQLKLSLKHVSIKAVMIQNTLGFPCDITGIQRICKQHDLILIEDLAHSVGSKYANGQEAGTIGDFTILSFSQDKVLDSVSGGALIIRDTKIKVDQKLAYSEASFQDKMYPLFTFTIRKTYSIKIGKAIHAVLKICHLLSNPMKNSDNVITDWHAMLVLNGITGFKSVYSHRKKISKIYAQNLNIKILSQSLCTSIDMSSCLRFPIFIKEREKLIELLEQKGVYISDIWYDSPIAPKKYLKQSGYKIGSCPLSEKTAAEILNLPTHINISEAEALELTQIINKWLI